MSYSVNSLCLSTNIRAAEVEVCTLIKPTFKLFIPVIAFGGSFSRLCSRMDSPLAPLLQAISGATG